MYILAVITPYRPDSSRYHLETPGNRSLEYLVLLLRHCLYTASQWCKHLDTQRVNFRLVRTRNVRPTQDGDQQCSGVADHFGSDARARAGAGPVKLRRRTQTEPICEHVGRGRRVAG